MIQRTTTFLHGSYLIWVSDDVHPPDHDGTIIWISRRQCQDWKGFIRTAIARRAQVFGCQVACAETADATLRAECRTLRKQLYPSSDQKLAKIANHLQLYSIADELCSRSQAGTSDYKTMIDMLDRTPISKRTTHHERQRWLFLALDML